MTELTREIITTTSAQADIIAMPTFVTDIQPVEGGSTPPGQNNGQDNDQDNDQDNGQDSAQDNNQATGLPSITLETTQTNITIGEEFEVGVAVDSGEEDIVTIDITINFDPDSLEVVDAEPGISGVQVEYLGSFTETQNSVDNGAGVIRIVAETATSTSLTEQLANITFRTTAISQGNISIDADESGLGNPEDENILEETNELDIRITEVQQGTDTDDDTQEEGELAPSPLPITDIEEIPKTDLPFTGAIYIAIGIILIYLGLMGRKIAGTANGTTSKYSKK